MAETKATTVSREDALKNLLTPNGKEIRVNHVRGSSMYTLCFADGGELPKDFEGMFTSQISAMQAARAYISRRFNELESKAKPTKVLE